MNLNRVLLIGRMAADPETRSTPNGQSVTTLRVATSRTWNDASGTRQEQTEFHTITVWGKQAENCQKYLVKGQIVFCEGRLQNRSWQAQDGTKRYATDIVADSITFGPKAAGTGSPAGGGAPFTQRPSVTAQQKAQPSKQAADDDEIPVINEDFPVANPVATGSGVDEAEIDLKDIPF